MKYAEEINEVHLQAVDQVRSLEEQNEPQNQSVIGYYNGVIAALAWVVGGNTDHNMGDLAHRAEVDSDLRAAIAAHEDLVESAKGLLTYPLDEDTNPEYVRALVELVAAKMGLDMDVATKAVADAMDVPAEFYAKMYSTPART